MAKILEKFPKDLRFLLRPLSIRREKIANLKERLSLRETLRPALQPTSALLHERRWDDKIANDPVVGSGKLGKYLSSFEVERIFLANRKAIRAHQEKKMLIGMNRKEVRVKRFFEANWTSLRYLRANRFASENKIIDRHGVQAWTMFFWRSFEIISPDILSSSLECHPQHGIWW